MAIHKVLVSRYRSKDVRFAEVGTSYNGRFTPIGTGLPTSAEINGVYDWEYIQNAKNRVVEFEGELYCVQRQDIYKYNSQTSKWELDHAAGAKYSSGSTYDFGDSVSLGLYISASEGINYLCHIWAVAQPGTWRSVRKQSKFSGTGQYEAEIVHTTPFTSLAGDATYDSSSYGGVLDVVEFNGKVYGLTCSAGSTAAEQLLNPIIFDLKSQMIGQIKLPSLLSGDMWAPTGALAAHTDRIFLLASNATEITAGVARQDGFVVCELIGSTMINSLTISQADSPGNDGTYDIAASKPIFFSDGEYLYAAPFVFDSVAKGYKMHQLQTSGINDLVDLGEISGILPDAMVRGELFSNPNFEKGSTQYYRTSVYTQVDASGNAEIILAHFNTTKDGAPATFWKWIDASNKMKYLGVGHGAEFALPSFRQGGGTYVWSEHKQIQTQIEEIEPSNIVGHVTMSYRIVNGSGQPTVVRFLYDNNSEFVTTFATLKDVTFPVQSSGAVASGSYVSGLVADSGILYKVDWAIESDGINSGETYVINPVSFVGNLIP